MPSSVEDNLEHIRETKGDPHNARLTPSTSAQANVTASLLTEIQGQCEVSGVCETFTIPTAPDPSPTARNDKTLQQL